MLDFISWKQFIAFISIATIIYYAWLFGTAKIKSLRNPSRKWKPDPPLNDNNNLKDLHILEGTAAAQEEESDAEEQKFKQLEKLADEIQELILTQKENITKEEMIFKLKSHISIYPDLNFPPFKTAINNLIDRCVRDFEILLSQQELDELWISPTVEEQITT